MNPTNTDGAAPRACSPCVDNANHKCYKWYFIPTKDEYLAKRIFDSDPNIKETFLPMKQEHRGGKLSSRLFISLYIFVYGDLDDILAALADEDRLAFTRNMLRSNPQRHCIPMEEMERFKTYCEANLKLGFLRNPYQFFKKNDAVRVLSGPFKGSMGKLEEIQGDLKLILNFGGWALWVGQINKFHLEVDYNHTAYKTEQGQLGRWFEYFTSRLARIGIADGFNEVLRSTIVDLIKAGSFDKLLKHTSQSYLRSTQSALPGAGAPTLLEQKLRFLRSLTSEYDQESLASLAHYFRNKEKTDHATLQSYFPDTNLRPFLTPVDVYSNVSAPVGHRGFTEIVREVTMRQGIYHGDTNTVDAGDIPYHAHFAIVPRPDGGCKVFINLLGLYSKYTDMSPEQQQAFKKKLLKGRFVTDRYRPYGQFLSILPITPAEADTLFIPLDERYADEYAVLRSACLTSPVRLDSDIPHRLYGLSLTVASPSDVNAGIALLLSRTKALFQEVLQATNLRPFQKALCESWVRRKEDYDIYSVGNR